MEADGAACFDTCRPNKVPPRPLPARNPCHGLRPHPSPLEVYLQRTRDDDTDDELLLKRLRTQQYAPLPLKLFQKKRAKRRNLPPPPVVRPNLPFPPPWLAEPPSKPPELRMLPEQHLRAPEMHMLELQPSRVPDLQPSRMPDLPQVRMPEPPQVWIPDPPQVRMPEPPQVRMPEPQQVRMPEPPQVRMPEPPQVRMPEPPQVRMPEPPQVRMPEPQQVRMSDLHQMRMADLQQAHIADLQQMHMPLELQQMHMPEYHIQQMQMPLELQPMHLPELQQMHMPDLQLMHLRELPPASDSQPVHEPVPDLQQMPKSDLPQVHKSDKSDQLPQVHKSDFQSQQVQQADPQYMVDVQRAPEWQQLHFRDLQQSEQAEAPKARLPDVRMPEVRMPSGHYRSPTCVPSEPHSAHTRVVSLPSPAPVRLVQTTRDVSEPRRRTPQLLTSQPERRPRKPVSRFGEPVAVASQTVAAPMPAAASQTKRRRRQVEVGVQTSAPEEASPPSWRGEVACCCAVHGPLRPFGGHVETSSAEEPHILTVPAPVVPALRLPVQTDSSDSDSLRRLPVTPPAENYDEAQQLPVTADLTSRLRVAVSAAHARSEEESPLPVKATVCAPAHVILLDADDTLIPTSELCETKFLDHELADLPAAFQASLNLLDEQLTRLFEELHSMVVLETDNNTAGDEDQTSNYVLSVVIITNATLSHIQSTFEKFLPKLVAFFQAKKIKVDELVCSARDIWSEEFPFEHFYEFWKAWTLEDILRELRNDGVPSVTVLSIGDDEPERKAAAYVESEMDGFVQTIKVLKMVTQPTIQDLLVQLNYIHEHLRRYVAEPSPFDLQLDLVNEKEVTESAQLTTPEIPDRIEALFIQFELKYEILFDAFRMMNRSDVMRFVSSLRVLKVRQTSELAAFVSECNQFLTVYRANTQAVDLTPPALATILEEFPAESHRSQEDGTRDPAVILNALQSVIKFLLQYPNLVSTLPNFGWHPPSSADFIVAAVHLFLAAVASD